MKAKIQVVIESEHGQYIVYDVANIARKTLSTGTLGLTIAEGKSLLQNLQTSIVNQESGTKRGQNRGFSRRCQHNLLKYFRFIHSYAEGNEI